MLPITPKGVRRYVRYNATRRGLFGGSKFWLGVLGLGYLRRFAGRISKKGEAPVVYSKPLESGHWAEIVHEKPRPTRRARRKGRKASAKATRANKRAELDPTRRNLRKATSAQRKAAKANRHLGPTRATFAALKVSDDHLTRRQRRRRARASVEPLDPLETLAARAINEE